MMPQKRNPDVFELIRGKAGRAVGNLTGLLVTVKGLPGGYNRDLQEDRQPILETGPSSGPCSRCSGSARPREVRPRAHPARRRVDYTQATDLAEALALKGVPFRTAYQLVGKLVRTCQEQGLPLARATPQLARQIDPRFDDEVLRAADPRASVARKRNAGGTGPAQVQEQIDALERHAARAAEAARAVPRLHDLFGELREAAL